MRPTKPLTTCVLACLVSLPAAFSATGQSATPPQQAEEQRIEAEKRKLDAEQRRLEQERNRLNQELQRATEAAERMKQQAQEAGRRAKEQAEQGARRARDEAQRMARRAGEETQRQYQRAFRMNQMPGNPGGEGEAQGGFGGSGQPSSDFERELFKAQGLDAGAEQGGAGAAFLGLSTTPAPASVRKRVELPDGIGLVVSSVEPGSPAEQAGVKQYDILHKLNDQLLVNMEQLAVLVRTFKPGEEVRLSVVRGGKPQELRARLGERRQPPQGQPGQPMPRRFGGRGVMPGMPPGQPGQPGQPPQPNQQLPRFWMPNPLRAPRLQPAQPVVPPAAPQPPRALPMSPDVHYFEVPTPELAPPQTPAPAPAPAPAIAPAPAPQLHVVPLPRPEAAPVAITPALPVPAPEAVVAPVQP